MTSIVENNLTESSDSFVDIDSPSYVDPNGYVFHHDGQIYRAIYPQVTAFYEKLFEEGTVNYLQNHLNLVPTRRTELKITNIEESLVLHHDTIEPLTYCVEWCPAMLLDAAKLTLNIVLELANRGYTLQDAYPWNIIFQSANPIFVDFTSIIPENPNYIWPAYSQYQCFFKRPLILSSLGKSKIARLLLSDNINGISLKDYYQNLSFLNRLVRPGVIFEYTLDYYLQKNTKLKKKLLKHATKKPLALSKDIRKRFIKRELNKLDGLHFDNASDPWIKYYNTIPKHINRELKIQVVQKLLQRISPDTVTDIGCNTGVFSIIAQKCGAKVMAIDSSEQCISNLYQNTKKHNYNILPIVADILCPTPSFGFFGNQYPGLIDRIKSDTVICLGLMHHLHINGRQSFVRISKLLAEITINFLIFEFISLEDENIELITTNRSIDYTLGSVKGALLKYFTLIDTCDSDRSTRKLLYLKK